MGYPEDGVVQTWLDALQGLNVRVKKMFGCYCLYCDNQPVGWLHEGVLSRVQKRRLSSAGGVRTFWESGFGKPVKKSIKDAEKVSL